MANENLKKLHSSLSKIDKNFTRTYEEFSADMQDPSKRTKLHASLGQKDKTFTRTFEEFSADMGFAKPSSQTAQPTFQIPAMYGNKTIIQPDPKTGLFTPEIAAGTRGESNPNAKAPAPTAGTWFKDLGEGMLGGVSKMTANAVELFDRVQPENIFREMLFRTLDEKNGYAIAESQRRLNNPMQPSIDKLKQEGEQLINQSHDTYGTVTEQNGNTTTTRPKDFMDLWKEGNKTGALGNILLEGGKSLPTSVAAFTPAGLAVIGASSFNEKYDAVSKQGLSLPESFINATGTAAFELLSEKIGAGIEKGWLKNIGKTGTKQATSTIKSLVLDFLKTQPKEMLLEGVEEGANKIASTVLDWATNAKELPTTPEGWKSELNDLFKVSIYGAGGGAFGGATMGGGITAMQVPGILQNQKTREQYKTAVVSPTLQDVDVNDDSNHVASRISMVQAKQAMDAALQDADFDFDHNIANLNPEEQKQVVDEILSDETLKPEHKQTIINYINAAAVERTMQENRQAAYNATMSEIEADNQRLTNDKTGTIVTGTIKGTEAPVHFIKGLSVTMDENNTPLVDAQNSDEAIYYIDENGETQVTVADNVTIANMQTPEERMNSFREGYAQMEQSRQNNINEAVEQYISQGSAQTSAQPEPAGQFADIDTEELQAQSIEIDNAINSGALTPEQTNEMLRLKTNIDNELAGRESQIKEQGTKNKDIEAIPAGAQVVQPNGNKITILSQNPDASYQVDVEDTQGNITEQTISAAEANNYFGVAVEPPMAEVDNNVQPGQEAQTTQDNSVQSEQPLTPKGEKEIQYPLLNDGTPDFDNMTVAQTYQYMTEAYGPESAMEGLKLQEKNIQSAISKNIVSQDKFKTDQYAELKKATTIQEQAKIRAKQKATSDKLTSERQQLETQLGEIRALFPQVEEIPATPEVKAVTSSNVRPEEQLRREQEVKQVESEKLKVESEETTKQKRERILKERAERGEIFEMKQIQETPQKFTINVANMDLPLAPIIPLESVDWAATFGSTFDDYELPNSVKLIEVRGRNNDGRLVGTVSANYGEAGSNTYEVVFNDNITVSEQQPSPKRKTTNPWQRRMNNLGEIISVEDYILRQIAGGAKFVWDAQPPFKGLAQELGFTDNPGEKELRKSMIDDKDGITPAMFAHNIYESHEVEMFTDDYQDIYNAVYEVLLSVNNATQALEKAEFIRNKYDMMQEDYNIYQSITPEEYAYLDEIPDDILESYLGITNFTPEQLDFINQLHDNYYGQTNTEPTNSSTSERNQGLESEEAAGQRSEQQPITPKGEQQPANLTNEDKFRGSDGQESVQSLALSQAEQRTTAESSALIDELAYKSKSADKFIENLNTGVLGLTSDEAMSIIGLSKDNTAEQNIYIAKEYYKEAKKRHTEKLNQQKQEADTLRAEQNVDAIEKLALQQTADMDKLVAQRDTQELDAEIAAQSHNNAPTDKQKETGIYDKARISLQGYNITIETLKNEERSGTDSNGKAWSITMNNHYGELDGTTGYDGDAIDVFVGPNPKGGQIFVIDQLTDNGTFDESKVMLGFDTAEEAKAAYMSNYEAGWQGFGSITPAGNNFKTWLYDGKKQRKPFNEYKETPEAIDNEQLTIDNENNTDQLPDVGKMIEKPAEGDNVQFQSENQKQQQFDIIQKTNPMLDDYHTGIRTIDDIKTLEEAVNDPQWDYDEYNPDYTRDMAMKSIKSGKITVYSSNKIENGVFVSPSKMEAESYSGDGKVYFKEVNISDVAWIDPTQGNYTKISTQLHTGTTMQPTTPEEVAATVEQLLKTGLAKEVRMVTPEEIAEMLDGAETLLRTPTGTIYGFVKGGIVYLNSSTPNLNTPIHEFGHLWVDAIEGSDLYNRGAKLVKETPYWTRVNSDPNYKDLSEAARIKEAMAMAIGDKGETVKQNLGLFARIKTWINDVWKRIGAQFGIQNLTPEQIQNLTFNDFVEVAVSELLTHSPSGIPLKKGKAKEMPATIDVDGIQRPTTNSLGKQIHSTEEGIRNFWKWFGDSKVVDAEGRPLVVYHGTPYSFNEFEDNGSIELGYKPSFWFTTDIELAKYHSRGGKVINSYLSIQNPKIGGNTSDIKLDDKYDGFISLKGKWDSKTQEYDYTNGIIEIVYATDPTQIKSATGNDGSFDPNDPDIRYQIIGERGAEALDAAEEATTRLDNLKVAKEMEGGKRNVLRVDENGRNIVWENDNYMISVNDPENATYIVLWNNGKKVGELFTTKGRNSATNGYLSVQNVEIDKQHRGKGLSSKMYDALLNHLGEKYKGISSENEQRVNKKQVPQIWKRLNATEVDGNYTVDKKQFTPQEIRIATGWERGVDGLWRYEIPDIKTINKEVFNSLHGGETYNTVKLQELIGEDNELLKSYPQLKGIDVARNNINAGGIYSSSGNGQITINEKLTSISAKSTLIHEIQHAIQEIEGFAKGGNVESIRPEMLQYPMMIKKAQEKIDDYYQNHPDGIAIDKESDEWLESNTNPTEEEYAEFEAKMKAKYPSVNSISQYTEIIKQQRQNPKTREEAYKRLSGEVEARNASARMNMSEEERRNTLLTETADVAPEDQIVLLENMGVSMSEPTKPEFTGNMVKYAKELTAYNQAIQAIKDKRKQLINKKNDGTLNEKDFKAQRTALNDEQFGLEMQKQRIEAGTSVPSDFEPFEYIPEKPEFKGNVGQYAEDKTLYDDELLFSITDTAETRKNILKKEIENAEIDIINSKNDEESTILIAKKSRLEKQFSELEGQQDTEVIKPEINKLIEQIDNQVAESKKRAVLSKVQHFFEKFREAYQNTYLPVIKLYATLNEQGHKIPDKDNFVYHAKALGAKNNYEIEQYMKNVYVHVNHALAEIIKKADLTLRDIENYVILKHGIERNKYMQEKAEKFGKKPQSDYSGVTAVLKELNSKKAEGEKLTAEEWIQVYEERIGEIMTTNLWKAVKQATDYGIDKQYESGILTAKKRDMIKGMYNYYIPLRGTSDLKAEDLYDYEIDGNSIFVDYVVPITEGHIRRSSTPFAYIIQLTELSISQSNENTMKQSLLRLAKSGKTNGLLTATYTWYDKEGKVVQEEPEYSSDPVQYEQNKKDFYEEMKRREQNGEVYTVQQPNVGDMFITPVQLKQHVIRVFQGGRSYNVFVNGDPSISRAVNKLNQVSSTKGIAWINKTVKFLSKLKNFQSKAYTSVMLRFILYTNPMRDLDYSTSNAFIRNGATYTAKLLWNRHKALIANMQHVGILPLGNNTKYYDYVQEYLKNGGKTGISQMYDIKDIAKAAELELKALTANKLQAGAIKTRKLIASVFENMNHLTETQSRIATYITSREAGRSVERSIDDSKEITVSFDTKGSGAYGNHELRSALAFVNVGIQGLNNHIEAITTNKASVMRWGMIVTARVATALWGISAINSILSALFGSDDDEWVKDYAMLSEFERRGNICIWTPKGFIKLPVSQEFRAYNGLGSDLFMWQKGYASGEETTVNFAVSMAELLAYNPILEAHQGSWADAVPVTALVPLAQLETNKTFYGASIYDEDLYGTKSGLPEYRLAKTNRAGKYRTPEVLVNATQFLNEISGGDKHAAGTIDINPDILNHLLNSYMGGYYKQTLAVINTFVEKESTTGDKINGLLIPDAAFRRKDDLHPSQNKIKETYYDIKEEVDGYMSTYRDVLKNAEGQTYEAKSEYISKYIKNHPEIEKAIKLSQTIRLRESINSNYKNMPDEYKQEADKHMGELELETVNMYKELQEE